MGRVSEVKHAHLWCLAACRGSHDMVLPSFDVRSVVIMETVSVRGGLGVSDKGGGWRLGCCGCVAVSVVVG